MQLVLTNRLKQPTCIAVEVRSNYFQLLRDIVLHQWNKIDAALSAIMQSFAVSFTLQDIEEVRRVIKMLDELNQKRKLFSSPKFRYVKYFNFFFFSTVYLIQI